MGADLGVPINHKQSNLQLQAEFIVRTRPQTQPIFPTWELLSEENMTGVSDILNACHVSSQVGHDNIIHRWCSRVQQIL